METAKADLCAFPMRSISFCNNTSCVRKWQLFVVVPTRLIISVGIKGWQQIGVQEELIGVREELIEVRQEQIGVREELIGVREEQIGVGEEQI